MKRILFIIFLIAFTVSGCSAAKEQNSALQASNTQNQSLLPEQVVENYFYYYNKKDKSKLLSTLTEWHSAPNVEFGFNNLKSIELNGMAEDKSSGAKGAYMNYGRGKINGVTEENVKIYNVEYTVKFKKENTGPENSGRYKKSVTLIRKDENSPWLIDEVGEG